MTTCVEMYFFILTIDVNLIEELSQLRFQLCKFLKSILFWVTSYNITELANITCPRLELINTTITTDTKKSNLKNA